MSSFRSMYGDVIEFGLSKRDSLKMKLVPREKPTEEKLQKEKA